MSKEQVPFTKGQTVRAKISNKLGTVIAIPEAAGVGMVEVRFDGDTGSAAFHHSRFDAAEVKHIDVENGYNPFLFRKGDFIQVITKDGDMFEGAALNELQDFGVAYFEVFTTDGKLMDFNYNYVEVVNLFRADIARGDMPKF